MFAQEITHYRRPDTTGVVWITPQQLDAVRHREREEIALNRAPVKVREIRPVVRVAAADANTEAQSILTAAPAIVAAALRSGSATRHPQPVIKPNMILKEKCAQRHFSKRHRIRLSRAQRLRYLKSKT